MRTLALLAALAVGARALISDHIDQSILVASQNSNKHTSDAEQDRVTSLPGAGDLDFELFAGQVMYITVDEDAERALFYTLAESSSPQPDKDPLVLFLNGGPGCSSIGGGFLSELGPFYPTPEGVSLVKNDYAWNQLANVVFLESPAFVGWSYSNTSEDAVVGDERTAKDTYEFLLRFLTRFPKYQDRPFWLAGESYAGHYLPNLSVEILDGLKNKKHDKDHLNFKGFLLGNPLTVPEIDSRGALRFWYTHGIISEDSYHGALENCDLTKHEPLKLFAEKAGAVAELDEETEEGTRFVRSNRKLSREIFDADHGIGSNGDDDRQKCEAYIIQAMDEMAGINIYDIYADVCLDEDQQINKKQFSISNNISGGGGGGDADGGAFLSFFLKQPPQPRYDPCISNEVEIYMNRPDVQMAFNANSSGHQQPGPWVTCTPRVEYSRKDVLTSMLPVYDQLLGSGLEFLVYSGDIDAIVPIIGTRRWIRKLGLEVEEKWRAWRSATGQVAGWMVKYSEGLTFASVRGAGHMVPYTQAERAFHMFSKWVHGKPL
ncbi:putative Serine carboxypeptidase 24 [Nannochloris sp. 'desiccata']|nr:putative Serine carboxypeptidase 24 [Chlorella desiccata (nom. nud.)]